MIDYPALAALAAVVHSGSFEGAARALGVTPSAVSQRVRALEERSGAILVIRGQPCRATPPGARLCAHLEQVRLLEAEMAPELPGLLPQPAHPTTLRIAVNADSLASWFLPAAARFAAAEGVLLDLITEDEGQTAARLRSGEVLAAVTAEATPLPGCRLRRLGTLSYIATAAPDFGRRWFPQGPTAAALAVAPVVQFDRHDRLQARWAAQLAGIALTAPTHWVPTTQGCLEATLLGMGWAMAPAGLAAPLLQSGRLVALAPGQNLAVPLFWQHARLGGRLLEQLTLAVQRAARDHLTP